MLHPKFSLTHSRAIRNFRGRIYCIPLFHVKKLASKIVSMLIILYAFLFGRLKMIMHTVNTLDPFDGKYQIRHL